MVAMLIVAFVALVVIQTILFSKLSEHRIDIGRSEDPVTGPSWNWWENALLHAKYNERGQRLKRWVLALMAAQLMLLVPIIW